MRISEFFKRGSGFIGMVGIAFSFAVPQAAISQSAPDVTLASVEQLCQIEEPFSGDLIEAILARPDFDTILADLFEVLPGPCP